jgi:ADP-heptose:LPS heptosyltransferase
LANTSCNEIAQELLGYCLRGEPWPKAHLERLLEDECSDALFRIVVEGLADRFDPRLCRVYEALFREILWRTPPGVPCRLQSTFPSSHATVPSPRQVFVLSRITLGADIAVASVILDAAKRRFPAAEIYLAGPRKNWELFAADPRIRHLAVNYRRGSLQDRLAHIPELRQAVDHPNALVIDPDSRLTQLGLVPLCAPENYLFFESRSYGAESDTALPELTSRWVCETLGIADARPFIAPAEQPHIKRPAISVSLGVGENAAKRIADPFEPELLRMLGAKGATIYIDEGAGGEEAERVERAIAASGLPRGQIETWRGSFAGFAAIIRASDFYAGYDSAGQHVAAACGVPLLCIFAGFPCLRMFQRWRPTGAGSIEVIRVDDPDPATLLARIQGLP